MNSATRKLVILILLAIVGITIYHFAFPYEQNLQKVTLKKRIDNELAETEEKRRQ